MLPLWIKIAVIVGWLAAVGSLAELLRRTKRVDQEIPRKVVHIGTGNVILWAWWLQTPTWLGIGAAVLAAIAALLSYRFPLLPGIDSVGRHSLGTFFYAVSVGGLTAWFWPSWQPQYAALGILIMTWGDGLAALVGQNYGRHPYQLGTIRKSWEGSLAMALVSWGLCIGILGLSQGWSGPLWGLSLLVAIAATGLEAFSTLGVDNLTVPLGSAALAYWLQQWLL
ncbi:Phytol kinase [Halomicronema hongdechloris C2206]|uniref:Phytol kinase n=1 Tax=Halomicronema hongdechloris C2206 TaxID=1641165 RepID=A0A1Z3HK07_9CYAN|nr:diacylglycerol/polyprenol kinase family protein [Halomicronema hongdechloris]ASC70649.1 Phytol kinase [Halomicronema hongdechloris C2206]